MGDFHFTDQYFANLSDNVEPQATLFPGLNLIYYHQANTDPVQTYKGLFDTIDKKKMGLTLERLIDLYEKRKPWPLTDEMVKNIAHAVSEGNVVLKKEDLPSFVSSKKKDLFHPLKIDRNESRIMVSWFSIDVDDSFPVTQQGEGQRGYTLIKFTLELSKTKLKADKALIESNLNEGTPQAL